VLGGGGEIFYLYLLGYLAEGLPEKKLNCRKLKKRGRGEGETTTEEKREKKKKMWIHAMAENEIVMGR